ncbi:MAG: OadG family protein [Lachnospiraceae bacterium]|nr:OadG family protein [Lachnospiraceae bacterium]
MKKKISLLLCLIFTVLTMAACGGDPTQEDYYGNTYSDLESLAVTNVEQLAAYSPEELAIVLSSVTDELTAKLVEGWVTTTAELGEYQGLDELVIAKANKTVTVDQYVNYPGRQVVVSFVLNYDYEIEQLVITDVTVDLVYTLGEKMEKAALNTLMGMGTVFGVLVLISLIIYCFRFIGDLQNIGKKKQTEEAVVTNNVPEVVEETPLTDDLELVAVISAAIAASEGTSTDSFVVRSIHRR